MILYAQAQVNAVEISQRDFMVLSPSGSPNGHTTGVALFKDIVNVVRM